MPAVPKTRKLDGRDGSHVSELLHTLGWALVKERVLQTRAIMVAELESPGTGWDRVNVIRGQIQSLDLAIQIPGILVSEAKKLGPKDPGEKTL